MRFSEPLHGGASARLGFLRRRRAQVSAADLFDPHRHDLGHDINRNRKRRVESNDGGRHIELCEASGEPTERVPVHDVEADVPARGADADQLRAIDEECGNPSAYCFNTHRRSRDDRGTELFEGSAMGFGLTVDVVV